MEAAIALLQSAIALLTLLASPNVILPDDLRITATNVANQSVVVANLEIAKAQNAPVSNTPMSENITPQPIENTSAPVAAAPVSQARIEIISPFPMKGINPNRTYKAAKEVQDESNYLVIGAIVYDDTGNPSNTAQVSFEATESSQNKTLNGTGDVTPRFVDGDRRVTPYYAFTYEFHQSGPHVIQVKSGSLTQQVSVEVQ